MDNTVKKLTLIFGQEIRSVIIKSQPNFHEILAIIQAQYPSLSERQFSIAYKVNGEFVLAKSDSDTNEAFRLAHGSNEVTLYIPALDTEDTLISGIDTRIAQLSLLSSEIQLIRQNYMRTVNEKQTEQEQRRQYYSGLLETERVKSTQLEKELQKLKDSISSTNTETAKFKESMKVLVNQYQAKIQEAAELKKERDEKAMLEARVLQLEKDFKEKLEENLTMSKRIETISEERNHFNKKAEELEVHQQHMESDYLNQSLKITTDPLSMAQPSLLPISSGANNSSLPFSVPADISEMDVQILLFSGIKLDTSSEQQRVFEMLRQKKDISQIIESLL